MSASRIVNFSIFKVNFDKKLICEIYEFSLKLLQLKIF